MGRKPKDYRRAADEAMAQAEALLGQREMTDREFLESMARADELVDHEDDCGHCAMQIIQAQTARDLLAAGDVEDGMRKWVEEHRRRWYATKYFQLYQEEKAAGRDPAAAFRERGWEM